MPLRTSAALQVAIAAPTLRGFEYLRRGCRALPTALPLALNPIQPSTFLSLMIQIPAVAVVDTTYIDDQFFVFASLWVKALCAT
ncbi:hypothetical protein B0H13DRAFT_2322186 [Mycena leptocephala]|nr:hypothetical protein B0H13DRAFT_2322186 [Mycena leptocephala]